MSIYDGRKILVTGGTGLMASHLIPLLIKEGANVRVVIHNKQFPKELLHKNLQIVQGDLTEKSFAKLVVKDIDHVFDLAAVTGGLGRTSIHPAGTLTPNLLMDGNVLDASKNEGVEHYLYGSCSCIYPNNDDDLSEDKAWLGDPPTVHASYSWSKRMGELQAIAYHKEYGMKISIVRPSNSYGPYDNFDTVSSHVIGALIIKATQKMNPFVIWGTGEPIREFIYAEDAARGMLLAMEKLSNAEPINLPGGENSTIYNLAKIIIELSGYDPKIIFDKSKPDGQMRRVLSKNMSSNKLGFIPKISLREGLEKTLEWYKNKKMQTEKMN